MQLCLIRTTFACRSDPYLPLDPPRYGDKEGSDKKRPLHSFKLPKDEDGKWEWEGPWEVDMNSGKVGETIDKDGWDYAFDFADLLNQNRAKKGFNETMDQVRRRRWIRTRVLEFTQSEEVNSAIATKGANEVAQRKIRCKIIWEVKANESGKKEITIRSPLSVTNTLPYDIYVRLQDGSVFGPLSENEMLAVPILKMKYAKAISVQPTKFKCDWSEWIPCETRSLNYTEHYDAAIAISTGNTAVSSNNSEHTLPIRILACQTKDSLAVTLYPHVKLINALPCKVHFKIAKSYEDLKNQNIIDQKLMNAGESSKLYFVNIREANFISLAMPGPYGWSEPVDMTKMVDRKGRVNVVFYGPESSSRDKKEISLLIRLQVQMSISSTSVVEIFSNSAFVDYTGLDIAISSVADKQTGEQIKRLSYAEDCSEGKIGSKIGACEGSAECVVISQLQTKSTLAYKVESHASPGVLVHTDRDYEFKYLPAFLLDQPYIRTAGDDRVTLVEGTKFLQFHVDSRCMVLLLIDVRVTKAPLWLTSEGFHPIRGERVVATGMSFSSRSIELNYKLYGKTYNGNETVSLGCNYSADARNMYCVFVAPANASALNNTEVIEQVRHAELCAGSGGAMDSTMFADTSWVAGGHGCTLFNTETGRVVVGAKRGTVWAKQEISLRGLDSASRKNGPFEVIDKESGTSYQLVYTVHFLPSLFRRMKVLTLMPRYCVVNCLDVPVYIRQYDKSYTLNDDWGDISQHRHVTTAKPFRTTGWHLLQRDLNTKVQIRLGDTDWCWGYFDINEIGSSQVLLVSNKRVKSKTKMETEVSDKSGASERVSSDQFNVDEPMWNSSDDDSDDDEIQPPIVINVDIKLGSSTDKCAVTVVFWTSDAHSSELSIKNNSKYPITIAQLDVINEIKKTSKKSSKGIGKELPLLTRQKQHVVHVPPNASFPFGWSFPGNASKKKKLIVGIIKDSSSGFSTQNKGIVDMRVGADQGDVKLFHPSQNVTTRNEHRAIVCVDLRSHGRVIRIEGNKELSPEALLDDDMLLNNSSRSRSLRLNHELSINMFNNSEANSALMSAMSEDQSMLSGSVDGAEDLQQQHLHLSEAPKESSKEFNFEFRIASIGVSVVADRPTRRELLSLYLDNVKNSVSIIDHILTAEFSILDMQIDNHSDTAVYPVLFRKCGDHSGQNSENVEKIPFVQVALLLEKIVDTGTISFRYLTGRILEFAVEVDSGTILLLLSDVLGKVKFLTPDQALAYANPQLWISEYNKQITSPIVTRELTDVYQAECMTRTSRILFEQLVFHPIKVSLSFLQTDLPKGREESLTSSNTLDTLVSVATVNSMEIRLNSFIVNNAVESIPSLQARIIAKTIVDVTKQLALIVGSLQVIGNPANLVSNVGNGVQDFFYEPYQGMVQSPAQFIKGVHKGTTSLVSGVVSGTLSSAAALVGTASSGISYLSGDQDFVRQRTLQRQKQQANRGGALSGMKHGGESVVSGFASGLSGIVLKPIEGAEQEGALGFFKGVGKGLMGAAVKPVLGVTDGITSVVEGISNEVGKENTGGYLQIRPRRALMKSKQSKDMYVLCRLDLDAAEAQQFVEKHASKKQLVDGDQYLGSVVIDSKSDVIISEHFVLYRHEPADTPAKEQPLHPSKRKCLSIAWSTIAHAIIVEGNAYGKGMGVELSGVNRVHIFIPCGSRSMTSLVYDLFIQNKEKLLNSEMMKDANSKMTSSAKRSPPITSTVLFNAPTSPNGSTDEFRDHSLGAMSSLQRGQTTIQNSPHKTFKYVFSTANNVDLSEFEENNNVKPNSEVDILVLTQYFLKNLLKENSDNHEVEELLDKTMWWLIFHWNHCSLSRIASLSSKSDVSAEQTGKVCCCAMLLNHSQNVLYVKRADVVLGNGVWMLCDTAMKNYRSSSGVIAIEPESFALVFATGRAASTYDSGVVEVMLHLTSSLESSLQDKRRSFHWNVSNKVNKCRVISDHLNDSDEQFRVEFLERTVADNWSKFVVLVSDIVSA